MGTPFGLFHVLESPTNNAENNAELDGANYVTRDGIFLAILAGASAGAGIGLLIGMRLDSVINLTTAIGLISMSTYLVAPEFRKRVGNKLIR